MIKDYYRLTKPGIVYGNLLPVIAGFFLASQGNLDWPLFAETMLGIGLVIGSACVFNNYLDREIDARMDRTKKRALASGRISVEAALTYGVVLGLLGFGLLIFLTDALAAGAAAIGFICYVVIYGWAKRNTIHSTLIGSISGAVPPLVGYCAVSDRIDLAAVLLFFSLVFWQMPHFYAIGIYRAADYRRASLPILPLKASLRATKWQMFLYTAAYVLCSLLFWMEGYTAYSFLLVSLAIGLWWLKKAWQGFKTLDDVRWARQMFGRSLVVLLVFSFILSIDWWLP